MGCTAFLCLSQLSSAGPFTARALVPSTLSLGQERMGSRVSVLGFVRVYLSDHLWETFVLGQNNDPQFTRTDVVPLVIFKLCDSHILLSSL